MQDATEKSSNLYDCLDELRFSLHTLARDVKQRAMDEKALKHKKRKTKVEARTMCLAWLEDDIAGALRSLDEVDRATHPSDNDEIRDAIWNISDNVLDCFVRGDPPNYAGMLLDAEAALDAVRERMEEVGADDTPISFFVY